MCASVNKSTDTKNRAARRRQQVGVNSSSSSSSNHHLRRAGYAQQQQQQWRSLQLPIITTATAVVACLWSLVSSSSWQHWRFRSVRLQQQQHQRREAIWAVRRWGRPTAREDYPIATCHNLVCPSSQVRSFILSTPGNRKRKHFF